MTESKCDPNYIENIKKYSKNEKRKSPKISASFCKLNTVKIGENGKYWQIRPFGKSQKWFECNGNECDTLPVASKKPVSAKKPVVAEKPVSAKKPVVAKKPVSAKKPVAEKPVVARKFSVKKTIEAKKPAMSLNNTSCPTGKERHPVTHKCVPKCKICKVRHPVTHKCVKKCATGVKCDMTTGICIDDLKQITQLVEEANEMAKNVRTLKGKRKFKVKGSQEIVSCANGKNVVWDVDKNGVMLAHTFQDPKTGKINNPPKGTLQAPIGWWMSEKFDGYRAIWDGECFRSKAGNIFVTPSWFSEWFPKKVALDGELYLGRDSFEKCGIFRSGRGKDSRPPDDEEWRKLNVKYNIFDAPNIKGPFEKRIEFVNKLVETKCKKKGCPLVAVPHILVKSIPQMNKMVSHLTSEKVKGEGIMLRAPNSPYESKRSRYLLKVKPLFDSECTIIGHNKGSKKYKDMLGAFVCRWNKDDGSVVEFDVSGMDDTVRRNYLKTHPIGTTITFSYSGETKPHGKPRHPNYVRKREKE